MKHKPDLLIHKKDDEEIIVSTRLLKREEPSKINLRSKLFQSN